MKKIVKTFVLIVGLMLFTGCGEKVLKCSKESSSINDEMLMSQVTKITFKNDKMTKVNLEMDVKLSDSLIKYLDSVLESNLTEFKSIEDINGFSYTTKKNDDGFTVKIKANLDKMTDSEKERFTYVNSSNNYEKEKAEMEEDGYVCE